MYFKIIGTGSYLPPKVMTNDDVAKIVETNDEWIRQRVGIGERHVSETESAADMALKAARNALEMSGTSPEELDLIICATITGDYVCPTVAGLVERDLGAHCPAYDVSAACSGFVFALDAACGYFARKKAKKALVIGADRLSKITDWTDRSTCVIFADGAGAAVLEACDEDEGYIDSILHTEGGDDVIKIPVPVGISPFYTKEVEDPKIYMEGQQTFKFAVHSIVKDITDVCTQNGFKTEDIDFVVPHQANIRILQMAAKKLGLRDDQIYTNIEKVGNMSAASVPCALDWLNREGKLEKGMLVAFAAFGGGLTSSAMLVRW